MKVHHILPVLMLSFILSLMLDSKASADCCQGWQGSDSSYNGYCANPRWGWYGARKSVKSAAEAQRDLSEFFAGKDVRIGRIWEHSAYFEAEVLDKNNSLIDRVIIHKRSGRIRSIQ